MRGWWSTFGPGSIFLHFFFCTCWWIDRCVCIAKRSREGVTEALWQRKREPHGFEMEYVHSKHQSRSALSERENPFGVFDKQTVVKGHVKINCVTWNEIYLFLLEAGLWFWKKEWTPLSSWKTDVSWASFVVYSASTFHYM